LPRKRLPPDVRSLARGYTRECILRLGGIMLDPGADEPASTSVAAAKILLDRGWGTAPQDIHVQGEVRVVLRKLLEDDALLIDAVAERET